MRVDIYRRPESAGRFTYLAVPEGRRIPDEAVAVDWEADQRGINIDDDVESVPEFAIDDPIAQINAKGYAITSIRNLDQTGPMHGLS